MTCQEESAERAPTQSCGCHSVSGAMVGRIRRLQLITLVWMLAECAIALVAADVSSTWYTEGEYELPK